MNEEIIVKIFPEIGTNSLMRTSDTGENIYCAVGILMKSANMKIIDDIAPSNYQIRKLCKLYNFDGEKLLDLIRDNDNEQNNDDRKKILIQFLKNNKIKYKSLKTNS